MKNYGMVFTLLLALGGCELNKKTLDAFPLGLERCYAQDFQPKKKGQLTKFMLYRLLRPNVFDLQDCEPAIDGEGSDQLASLRALQGRFVGLRHDVGGEVA